MSRGTRRRVDIGARLRGVRRLAVYLVFTLTLVTLQAIALKLRVRAAETIPIFYHRHVCRIMGVRVATVGTLSTARPTLWVSNHLSYLDIEVLGSLLRGSFVAKAEVARWPLFGMLARLQRTVFVDRKVGSTHVQRDNLKSRLEDGDSLILFPEGTSSDGNRALPFKSALFAVAGVRVGDRPLTVQPVSLACTALDGLPMGRSLRPLYAWYGDMDLAPHLWSVACQGGMTVTIVFHDPVTIEDLGSRKALADHCWRQVALGLSVANAGRLETLALPAGAGASDAEAKAAA